MVLEFKQTKGTFFGFHWDLFSMKIHCSLGKAETILSTDESQTVSLKITFFVHGDVTLLPVLSCLATGYRRIFFSKICKSSRFWDQDMYSYNQPPSNFPSAFYTYPSCPSWWFSSWSLDLLLCPISSAQVVSALSPASFFYRLFTALWAKVTYLCHNRAGSPLKLLGGGGAW